MNPEHTSKVYVTTVSKFWNPQLRSDWSSFSACKTKVQNQKPQSSISRFIQLNLNFFNLRESSWSHLRNESIFFLLFPFLLQLCFESILTDRQPVSHSVNLAWCISLTNHLNYQWHRVGTLHHHHHLRHPHHHHSRLNLIHLNTLHFEHGGWRAEIAWMETLGYWSIQFAEIVAHFGYIQNERDIPIQ